MCACRVSRVPAVSRCLRGAPWPWPCAPRPPRRSAPAGPLYGFMVCRGSRDDLILIPQSELSDRRVCNFEVLEVLHYNGYTTQYTSGTVLGLPHGTTRQPSLTSRAPPDCPSWPAKVCVRCQPAKVWVADCPGGDSARCSPASSWLCKSPVTQTLSGWCGLTLSPMQRCQTTSSFG